MRGHYAPAAGCWWRSARSARSVVSAALRPANPVFAFLVLLVPEGVDRCFTLARDLGHLLGIKPSFDVVDEAGEAGLGLIGLPEKTLPRGLL